MKKSKPKKQKERMLCWHCGEPMIWGCDYDFADCGIAGGGIVSTFSCSDCPATGEIVFPFEEKI